LELGVQKRVIEVNGEVVNVSSKALSSLMITVEVKEAEDGRVVSTCRVKLLH
jgi:hypothetical protein